VLSGIEYDAGAGRVLVTGKHWPALYQIGLATGRTSKISARRCPDPRAWSPDAVLAVSGMGLKKRQEKSERVAAIDEASGRLLGAWNADAPPGFGTPGARTGAVGETAD